MLCKGLTGKVQMHVGAWESVCACAMRLRMRMGAWVCMCVPESVCYVIEDAHGCMSGHVIVHVCAI